MRKPLFLLLAVILMVMSEPTTNALCPDGNPPVAVAFVYNGCPATAYYCYYAVGTGYWCDLVEVEVLMPCGLNLVNDELFWDEAVQQMIDHAANVITFPPCPLADANVNFRRSLCWQIENLPSNGMMRATPCNDEAFCLWHYIICTDYSQTPPVIYKELVGYAEGLSNNYCGETEMQHPDSTLEIPDLPPAGYTLRDPWVTECFQLWCGCDD